MNGTESKPDHEGPDLVLVVELEGGSLELGLPLCWGFLRVLAVMEGL
jgi:hypothetical protein